MNTVAIRASADQRWSEAAKQNLELKIKEFDFTNDNSWGDLDILSNGTTFEGAEIFVDSAIVEGDTFIAPGSIYVALNYDEDTHLSEAFPIRIKFLIEDNEVEIKEVEVDTTSFFE